MRFYGEHSSNSHQSGSWDGERKCEEGSQASETLGQHVKRWNMRGSATGMNAVRECVEGVQ